MRIPCYQCERRHENCHAGCDDYKSWSADHKAKHEEMLINNSIARTLRRGKIKYIGQIALEELRRGKKIR